MVQIASIVKNYILLCPAVRLLGTRLVDWEPCGWSQLTSWQGRSWPWSFVPCISRSPPYIPRVLELYYLFFAVLSVLQLQSGFDFCFWVLIDYILEICFLSCVLSLPTPGLPLVFDHIIPAPCTCCSFLCFFLSLSADKLITDSLVWQILWQFWLPEFSICFFIYSETLWFLLWSTLHGLLLVEQ